MSPPYVSQECAIVGKQGNSPFADNSVLFQFKPGNYRVVLPSDEGDNQQPSEDNSYSSDFTSIGIERETWIRLEVAAEKEQQELKNKLRSAPLRVEI